jgi:hypothetical protein
MPKSPEQKRKKRMDKQRNLHGDGITILFGGIGLRIAAILGLNMLARKIFSGSKSSDIP